MQELNFSEYWHVLLKRKWTVIFTFMVFLGFSLLFTRMQVPVYLTSAHVRIDQYKSVMNVISDLLRWSPGEIMSTEVETVQSPIVLGRVAEKLKLIPSGASREVYYGAVSNLRNQVSAERVERTNMIRIEVTSSDPEQAARIANMVAEVYREVSHENKSKDIHAARAFVEEQLEKARKRLKQSEEALRSYKELHGALSVDSETSLTLDRLSNLETDLLSLRAERENVDWEISQLRERPANPDIEFEMESEDVDSSYISSFYQALNDVRQKITDLLRTHTDSNPEVEEYRKEEKRLERFISKTIQAQHEARIQSLLDRAEELKRRESQLSEFISRELASVPDKDLQLSRLTREVHVNEELYTLLNREFKEAQIKEMGMVSEVTLVSPALAPRKPIKPNKRLNLLIGVLMGLILGTVLAALVETSDTSIGAVEEIERLLEVPVLAAVPHFGRSTGRRFATPFQWIKRRPASTQVEHRYILPTLFNPSSIEAEAYRHLRTNLQFAQLEDDRKVFLVSSSGPHEGKSLTCSNLAVTLAQGGQRILLVSCNLRRPSIYKIFGLNRKPGLSDTLVGSCSRDEAIHSFADIVVGELDWESALKLPGIDNLFIMPAGTLPPNPAELLESQRMTDFIAELKIEYDIILLDAPPVLPVADALLLGPKADGAILVYQIGHLPRRALIRTKNQMAGLGIHIVGIVLNDVRPEFHGVAPVYISPEYISATKKVMESK